MYQNKTTVLDNCRLQGNDIWNFDESCITTIQKADRIIARRGQKQVSVMTSAERGTLVTIALAGNAAPLGIMCSQCASFRRNDLKTILYAMDALDQLYPKYPTVAAGNLKCSYFRKEAWDLHHILDVYFKKVLKTGYSRLLVPCIQ
ncbi:hypothetical protein NQ318_010291, partial [Aromia moschata]